MSEDLSVYVCMYVCMYRADNILTGSKQEQLDAVRQQIRDFKAKNGLDKVSN